MGHTATYSAGASRGDRHPDLDELWLGDRSQSQQSFHGAIDDFGIWSRTLSDLEVQGLYNAGHGAPVIRTR